MNENHGTSLSRRDDRIAAQIAHEAAAWIVREASTQSLITVTRASLAARGTHATVYVSIFPITEIRPALAFLERSRADFAHHLRAHTRIASMPSVTFALDDGSSNTPPLDTLSPKA